MCLRIRGGGVPHRLYAEEFTYTGDVVINEEITAGADDGDTYNIKDGTLTLKGGAAETPAVSASDGGELHFQLDNGCLSIISGENQNADGIYLHEATLGNDGGRLYIEGDGDVEIVADVQGEKSNINVADGSVAILNNRNTFLSGFSSAALRVAGGSSLTINNFVINIDRTVKDLKLDFLNPTWGNGVALYGGSSFTAHGTADIHVKGNVNDYAGVHGIRVYDSGSNAMFKNDVKVVAEGGKQQAYALGLYTQTSATFEGFLDATARDNSVTNSAIVVDGAKLYATDASAKASGGSYTYGLNVISGTAHFSGRLTVEAMGAKTRNRGINLENIGMEPPSELQAAGADVTVSGGKYAYGLRMLSGGTANFGGTLSIGVQDASTQNFGIYALNTGTRLSVQNGDTIVKLSGGADYSMGLCLNSEAGAFLSGHTDVTVQDNAGVNYGLYVADSAVLDAAGTAVRASGGEVAYGIYLTGSGKSTFSNTLNVAASDASDVNIGMTVQDGSELIAQDAVIASDGTAIIASESKVSFAGNVVTDADATAVGFGDGGKISFAKGLVTLAESTTMTASNGASISVNSTGAGTVRYTGTTSAESDGTIDMTMNGANSYWRMTGDSSASTLANSGALLDMTADGNKFSTLTLNNLDGANGLVAMDIDASKNTDNSDMILVGDTFSGTQLVNFNRTDGGTKTDAAGTVIAKVQKNNGKFIAPDTEGGLFYTRYLLDTKDSETAGYTKDWYIKELANVDPAEKPTTTVSSVMSAASLNYHTWRTQIDKLMQRMGDLRKGGGENNGAWFRFGGSKLSYDGDYGFKNEYMYYEVGYDRIVRETSKYTWFGGVAFSYGEGDSSYSRGDGENESKAVSLYLTQINKGGSYLDLVFKLGRWDNDFAVYDTRGERITGETKSTGISFSAEYGKKIALNKNGFYIEPQAQLAYGHLDGDTYTTSNGVSVHQDGIESLVGRVGFNIGWDVNKTSNIYLKANVLHEFLGDYGVSMSDAAGRARLTGDYGDTWFEYGLGAAFKFGRPESANFFYCDVERSDGGDLEEEWHWNAGFRFEM